MENQLSLFFSLLLLVDAVWIIGPWMQLFQCYHSSGKSQMLGCNSFTCRELGESNLRSPASLFYVVSLLYFFMPVGNTKEKWSGKTNVKFVKEVNVIICSSADVLSYPFEFLLSVWMCEWRWPVMLWWMDLLAWILMVLQLNFCMHQPSLIIHNIT